jgi:diaminohydroxyphosphoribosylaminopyrimidine deaminase/5-amino-6-(5-phosphoribosylamino)uracil reductase
LVVVDSRLDTPLDAQLFIAGRSLFIYCAVENAAKQAALQARGATVVHLPRKNPDSTPSRQVDLAAMLGDLAAREVNEVHLEAGQALNGALMRAGLIDELVLYLAPKLIGQGLGMADFGPLQELAQALPLQFMSTEMIGPDLRIVARVAGRDQF